jgi:CHAD domain-containing protein
MAWRFEPGEGLREAFSRVAREEVARVRGCLSARQPDLETAVHEARQGFKRLRALLRLAKPQLGQDFAVENRRWRDASRLLSGSRDTTVLLQTFDKIIAKCNGAMPASQSRRLRAAIESRADKNGGANIEPDVREVLSLLDEADEAIVRLNWPDSPASLLKGLRKSQGRLRKDWKRARKTAEADALHSWRKSVKDQAAQLRLLRGVAPARMRARRNDEKKAGELLGDEHDLWLLSEHLRSEPSPSKLAAARDILLSEIGKERESLREEAFKKGKGFSSAGAKSFAGEIASAWRRASSRKRKPRPGKTARPRGRIAGSATSPGP